MQALVSYALHFLKERGWEPVHTPYWLHGDVMARCAQLSQFDDELYRWASTQAPVASHCFTLYWLQCYVSISVWDSCAG